MKELTTRQQQVLEFIRSFTQSNSCPPTLRETGEYFSISLRAVQDHFTALRKKGYLASAERRSRSLRVLVDESGSKIKQPCIVPVLGTVAAGSPVFCDENYEDSISIPGYMLQQGASYFALHVRGDSMMGAGILDGDTAIIRRQEQAENGAIVLALIEDSVTLKRFFRETSRIRLQPENSAYKPIFCQDIRILGVLSNIIRNY